MSKIVVIHQPDFLPYLGFFHRLLYADLFVVLDNVQFVKAGWHHRDKIKTRNGEQWLTVSVKKAPTETNINQMLLFEGEGFRKRHLNLLSINYGKSEFYEEVISHLNRLYSYECSKLADFNMKSLEILMELFAIDIEYIFAGNINAQGIGGNEINVDILRKTDATHYLSGLGALNYHRQEPYRDAGLEVVFQNFKHPVYPQQFGDFIPYLSSIDLLFNCGIEKSREILRSI